MTAPVRIATPRIAVAGATGEVAGRVARMLAARGVAQRLPVLASLHAPRPALADVIEVGGYTDRAGMVRALDGIETFLLVPRATADGRVEAHRAAIDAAVEAGVRRIVFLSTVGAAPTALLPEARDAWATEQDLRASGLEFTIARMNVYLDLLPQFVSRTGQIVGPAGPGRVAAISRDDAALALTELILGDGHAGEVYELTGAEAITVREIAAAMSRSSRHTITFCDEPFGEPDVPGSPAATPAAELWRSSCPALAAGELERVTGDVQLLTGQSPMALADWLRAYPFSLVHVGALL